MMLRVALQRNLLALTALGLTAATILAGCATPKHGHQTADDFEPVWEKLVVPVQAFPDRQPAGVAVSQEGRVFVCFPWWNDRPYPSVAEVLEDGSLRPFPSTSWNRWDGVEGPSALRGFVCAQALYVDDENHLWILDAGSPRNRSGLVTAGPKLFRIDLNDNSIAQVFYFDHERDFARDSYLSDFRVDTVTNTAYISDSGQGGIYVVDLKTRETMNVLLTHQSTKAELGKSNPAIVGSRPLKTWYGDVPQLNVAGLELSPDRKWLYYHALSGRTLYRVPTELVRDPEATDEQRAAAVEDLGSTGSLIDGMWMTRDGSLYLCAIEKDAILVRRPGGKIETFVADERLQWPDSICLADDGYLYFTTSMRHLRLPYKFELVGEPYYVMKASIDNVEAAIAARDAADQAEIILTEAQAEATAAAARAAAKAQQEAIAKALAEREARLAEAASQRAARADQTREGALSQAEQAAREQAQAAEEATLAAEVSQAKADEAKQAAKLAALAAEEARRKAQAAKAKAKEHALAAADAKLSKEQAEAARLVREEAVAAAEFAAKLAEQANRRALEQLANANEADREAQAARAAAEAEQRAAQALQSLVEDARLAFEVAQTKAIQAELVEINKTKPDTMQTADVPTE